MIELICILMIYLRLTVLKIFKILIINFSKIISQVTLKKFKYFQLINQIQNLSFTFYTISYSKAIPFLIRDYLILTVYHQKNLSSISSTNPLKKQQIMIKSKNYFIKKLTKNKPSFMIGRISPMKWSLFLMNFKVIAIKINYIII